MEVHHHSHTSRKKWTHYFWEFLMLFLAVFAGFLAENQREHYVERHRASVYASNLYEELRKDTGQLNHLIQWTKYFTSRLDTLCAVTKELPPANSGKLYYYSRAVAWSTYFSPETSTIDQLKSSGNLRIMKTNIALKISQYERQLESLQNDYIFFRNEYSIMNALRLKIFDGFVSETQFGNKSRDSAFYLNPPLINSDPALMKEFIGWVKIEAGYWRTLITEQLEPINAISTELIGMLKKEYHLQ